MRATLTWHMPHSTGASYLLYGTRDEVARKVAARCDMNPSWAAQLSSKLASAADSDEPIHIPLTDEPTGHWLLAVVNDN